MKYYTMVEMAKIIGIPESTARGYRDRFPSYMSTTGHGRGKRYTEEAMEALSIVAPMSRDGIPTEDIETCLLYTSDAADEEDSVDLGGRRIIKKKKKRQKKEHRI